MAPRGLRQFVLRGARGLVTRIPASLLQPGDASVAENVELDEGIIARREGWTKVNPESLPSANAVTSLYPFYFQSTKQLLATAGTYLMRSTGGSFTTISSTFVPTSPARPTYASLNDAAYIAAEYGAQLVQALQKWDGTTLSTPTGAPSGNLVAAFSNALWVAGDTSASSRLRFSGQVGGAPSHDEWPALNYIDIIPGDGDKITGLGRSLHALVVLKERSIHRVVGTPPADAAVSTGDIQVFSLADQPGCVAPRSVSSNRDVVTYLGRNGIYVYDGVQTNEITSPIRDFFSTLDQTDLRNAVGSWVSSSHYLLAVEDSSNVVNIVSVHTEPQSITLWKMGAVTAISVFQFTGEGEKAVFGFNNAVGKYGGNTDNGSAITWKFQTGALSLGFPQYSKLIRRGQLKAKAGGGNITVQALKDFTSTGASQTIDLTASGTEDIVSKKLLTPGLAKTFELLISGNGSGASPKIHEISFEYIVRRI